MSDGLSFRPVSKDVLVVDDNVHMRKLVTTILQAFGIASDPSSKPIPATRAWEHHLRSTIPMSIVVDWVMEGMSSIDLIKMIRSNPQSPNPFIPVPSCSPAHLAAGSMCSRRATPAPTSSSPSRFRSKTMMSRLTSVIEAPHPALCADQR